MRIAIDITALMGGRSLQHRVRGSGFYIENLKRSLLKYNSENTYIFFTRGELVPRNVDLVHYPYFEPFFLTLPMRKRFRTVVTVHDLIPFVFPQQFPPGIRGRIKWQVQKFALQQSDAIITDSEASKRDIAQYTNMSDKKVHIVYLAANKEFKQIKDTLLLDRIKVKYQLPEKFVLYVGDVTWNKNLPRLVEAIKKINLTLVMVGKALVEEKFDKGNPWNRDLVTVNQLIKDDRRFIRLGFVSQDDLVSLYNTATVFAMPSLYEGFGLPVLEAMTCGIPVVTSREGSVSEIAGAAAFFVDPYDTESIANGIGQVFFSKELQNSLSKKGLQQAEKFSWRKTAADTVWVYEKVLGK